MTRGLTAHPPRLPTDHAESWKLDPSNQPLNESQRGMVTGGAGRVGYLGKIEQILLIQKIILRQMQGSFPNDGVQRTQGPRLEGDHWPSHKTSLHNVLAGG